MIGNPVLDWISDIHVRTGFFASIKTQNITYPASGRRKTRFRIGGQKNDDTGRSKDDRCRQRVRVSERSGMQGTLVGSENADSGAADIKGGEQPLLSSGKCGGVQTVGAVYFSGI